MAGWGIGMMVSFMNSLPFRISTLVNRSASLFVAAWVCLTSLSAERFGFGQQPSPATAETPNERNEEERLIDRLTGLLRCTKSDPRMRIARLLQDMRKQVGNINADEFMQAYSRNGSEKTAEIDAAALKFFQELGRMQQNGTIPSGAADPIPMLLVNEVKSQLLAYGGVDFTAEFLGQGFRGKNGSPVEAALLGFRRKVTLEGIQHVARLFRGQQDFGRLFLAFVGSWVSQDVTDFTISGDIDFSFVGGNRELLIKMRDAFNAFIQSRTGMDMRSIDSLCTAHGDATPDVYVGDAGRVYGDDAIAGGDVAEFDLRNGTIDPYNLNVDGMTAIAQTLIEKGIRNFLADPSMANIEDAIAAENERVHVEPALSFEMVRHLEHDIIANSERIPLVELIVKGCKYLERSNSYTRREFGGYACDPVLAQFADRLLAMKKNKAGPAAMATVITEFLNAKPEFKPLFGVDFTPGADGKPVAILRGNQQVAGDFLSTCRGEMWKNVSMGLENRLVKLGKSKSDLDALAKTEGESVRVRSTAAGLRAELDKVMKGILTELQVCDEFHVVIPTQVQEQCRTLIDLAKSFELSGAHVKLTPEQEKQLELIEKLMEGDAHQPHTLKLAAALVMDLADKTIESTNARLDWLDDKLMGPLRNEPTFESWLVELNEYKMLKADPAAIASPVTRAKIVELQSSLYGRYKSTVVDLEMSVNSLLYQNCVSAGITKINVTLNEFLNKDAASRRALKGLTAFNLISEMNSYVEAYSHEGFSGLAAEIIRRRVPFGSAAEALYNGRYCRATWDTITTIFPPLALPEAAYGIAYYALSSARDAMWSAELEAFIDGLYASADFDIDLADPNASPQKYVLVKVTHGQKTFTKEALLKGDEFILNPDVDMVLWANLAQNDPFLDLMTELQNHPAAGPRIRDRFVQQYEARWKVLKKDFVTHLVDKLEKRRQGARAANTSQIVAIQDELTAILDELGIADRVHAEMDREVASNLGAFWTWLKNKGRSIVWGGALSETQAEQMARTLIKYRDGYKAVLAARTSVELAVKETSGVDKPVQHTLRLLTGVPFLRGRLDEDGATAARWRGLPEALLSAVTDELTAVKREYIPNAVLDAGADQEAVKAIFFEDVWIFALRTAEVPVFMTGAIAEARSTHEATRAALLDAFRARYATAAGMFRLTVLQRLGTTKEQVKAGMPENAPVLNAKAVLVDAKGKSFDLHAQGRGVYQAGGLSAGAYTLKVSAEGFKDERGAAEHEEAATVSRADSGAQRADELTLTLVPDEAAKDALAVHLDRTPAEGSIRSAGEHSTAIFTATVTPKPDSGRLRYQWAAGPEVLSQGESRSTLVFSGEGRAGQTLQISVLVIDEKQREGKAFADIDVIDATDLKVVLKDHRRRIFRDQGETLTVIDSGAEPGMAESFFWTVQDADGQLISKDEVASSRTFNVVGSQFPGRRLVVSVLVQHGDGRTGKAATTIDVTDADAPTKLAMSLTPERSTIPENGYVDITAQATPLPDSGEIVYSWDDGRTWTSRTGGRVSGDGQRNVTFTVSVLARDKLGRFGSATASVYVRGSDDKDTGRDDATTSTKPDGPAAPTDAEVLGKLKLGLEVKCDKTVLRVGDTAYLNASYTADNYVRSRLKWVWSPDLGARDYATFKAEEPGVEKTISVKAFLPVQGKDIEVGSGSVTITVLEPARIRAPSEVLASDIFDASIDIPASLRGRYSRISWSAWTVFDASLNEIGSYKPTDLTAVKIQIPPRPRDYEGKAAPTYSVGASLVDDTGRAIEEASQQVIVHPAMISATGADVWKGGSNAEGFGVTRTEAVRTRQEKSGAVKSATVTGRLSVKWSDSITVPKSAEELRANVEAAQIWQTLPPAGASEGKIAVVPFAIGDFKGFMKKTTQVVTRYNGNPWGYVDVSLPQAGVAGYGEVMKGKVVIIVSYNAGGGGMALGEKKPWWDDMPFITAHTQAADSEIQAMLGSIRISADGRFDTVPYSGPKLDGSDAAQPLSVTLAGPTKPLGTGKSATVKASVLGGTEPYSYSWTGDHAGAGSEVSFIASKAGDYRLSVQVTDAANQSANAEITIKVEGLSGQISGLRGKVVYGEQVRIMGSVEGVAGAQEAIDKANAINAKSQAEWDQMIKEGLEAEKHGGGFILPVDEEEPATVAVPQFKFIWHADKEGIAFDPPDGLYATVTFGRMGETKIWAQIIDGTTGASVGETPQQTVNVVAPKFRITFDPPAGKPGQEIRANVFTDPMKLHAPLFYRWSVPESANRMEYDASASQIGFKVKDAKPYRIIAVVEVPHYRDVVENIDATFTPGAYAVKASVIENETTKPKVWDAVKGGIITLPRGTYAGDERIQLRAELVGEPKLDDVRWNWAVNDGTSISNEISQTPTVSRHETGTITATVTAKDKDGVVLGTDTLSLSVTVPPEPLEGFAVTIQSERSTVKSGQSVALQAAVRGGTAPFGYQWSGVSGNGQAARFSATKAGAQNISVTVRDGKGKAASASVSLIVEPVTLGVRIKADRTVARAGDTISLSTSVTGGTAPYSYAWQSPLTGKDANASYSSNSPGTQNFAIEVTDVNGNRGTATMSVQIDAARADITGLQSREVQGATREIALSTDAAAPWEAVFHAQPAIAFTPPSAGRCTAMFNNPGSVVIWAEVRKRVNGALVSVARTREYEVQVEALRFTLSFQPVSGRVGESVQASLTTQPAFASASSNWTVEWSGPAEQRSAGTMAVAFTPEDTSPVSVSARVRDRVSSVPLGDASATYTASPAEVKVIAEPGKHAAGRPVLVHVVSATGASLPQAKVEWSVENGAMTSAASSMEASVIPARTGMCRVTAMLRSSKGGAIGSGSTSFDVLSAEEVDAAHKPVETPMDATAKAQSLINEGYALEQAGQIQGAIGKYEEALKAMDDARLTQHVQELKTKMANAAKAQELINDGYALEKAGKPAEALGKYSQALQLFPDPGLAQKIESMKAELSGGPDPRFYMVDLSKVGGVHGSGEMLKDVLINRSSWIRLKELADKPVYRLDVPIAFPVPARSVAIVSNLDSAHSVQQGQVVTHMTVIGDEGQETFDIVAGVHSSEWNRGETGGADHLFPKAAALGGGQFMAAFALNRPLTVRSVRFDYVRLDKKYWHSGITAHGFVLRGMTLLRSGAAIPSAAPPLPPDATAAIKEGDTIAVSEDMASKAKPVHVEGNVGAVGNRPTAPSLFTAQEPMLITYVFTYHWNFGRGAKPGTVSLRHSDGTVYGPWQMTGHDGQGGVKNATWDTQPNIVVKAGTYTIVDSDPSTWAQNAESGGRGMCEVRGIPVREVTGTAPGSPATQPAAPDDISYLVDLTPNGGKRDKPMTARGVLIESSSYIRLKSTDEKRLAMDVRLPEAVPAQGLALLACLDDSTYVKTGEIMAIMTVRTSAGDQRFELKAGIHASDWNYGEHADQHANAEQALISRGNYFTRFDLPAGVAVTGLHFDYVKTKSPLWFGHAPGFVIKGITIIRSSPIKKASIRP